MVAGPRPPPVTASAARDRVPKAKPSLRTAGPVCLLSACVRRVRLRLESLLSGLEEY